MTLSRALRIQVRALCVLVVAHRYGCVAMYMATEDELLTELAFQAQLAAKLDEVWS